MAGCQFEVKEIMISFSFYNSLINLNCLFAASNFRQAIHSQLIVSFGTFLKHYGHGGVELAVFLGPTQHSLWFFLFFVLHATTTKKNAFIRNVMIFKVENHLK